jgi:hypothetical protein
MTRVYGLGGCPGPLTSAAGRLQAEAMTNPSSDRPTASPPAAQWVHICERCGERMEERQCKIICLNCGLTRDCSDP